MELHGVVGKPYKHPEVRRTTPAAYQRPRIDLDGGRRVKRDWKDTSVADLVRGDTIAGFGTIEEIIEIVNVPGKFGLVTAYDTSEYIQPDADRPFWSFRVVNVAGECRDFPGEQRVFAFSRDPK